MNLIEKLRSLADEIESNENTLKTQEAWALVGRLIARAPVHQGEASRVVKEQDVAGLRAVLGANNGAGSGATEAESNSGGATASAAASASVPGEGGTPIAADDLAAAMRAFKKRLKLVRLNEESKLGGRQLSGGRRSEVDAIQAPIEYPPQVWRVLVEQGRLVDTGGGFYALPGEGGGGSGRRGGGGADGGRRKH